MKQKMIQFVERYFVSSDGRGAIEGLINFGKWEELNYISSDRGTIRGNHYHKSTREAFIILSGRINVTLQKVLNCVLVGNKKEYTVIKGQVFVIEPMINHVFYVEDPSEWLNLLSCKIDQKNPDIFRVQTNI